MLRPLIVILIAIAATAAEPPRRIVSTTPSITEILFAVGAGAEVVGVSNFCRYPPSVLSLPKVGNFIDPQLESILALRPDLVIVQRNPVRLGERMRAAGLRVVEVNPADDMSHLEGAITAISESAGKAAEGKKLVSGLNAELDRLRKKTATLPKTKVAFFVGRSPGRLEGLIAAGKGSYLSYLFQVAGGENIFDDARTPYPKVTHEELIARDPDIILDMGDSAHPQGTASAAFQRSVLEIWRRLPMLKAVRTGRVRAVADDRFVIPGPRIAEAAREFARLLHPEVAW